jgi:uncharacterized repeat protein (TIGR01451 family)
MDDAFERIDRGFAEAAPAPATRPSSITTRSSMRTPLWLLPVAVALACCSCTTVKSMARTEDFSEEVQRSRHERSAAATRVAEASSISEMNKPGETRLGRKSEIQLVSQEESYCPPDAITSCPPEPRMPVAGPNPFAVGMPAAEAALLPDPRLYADEYLCDGGDRDWPVHYGAQERLGLDTEDTVAEYVDHHGAEHMKPSNKVCVYAPRFAAVRTISQPVLGESLATSVGMNHQLGDDALHTRVGSTQKVKRDAVGGLRMRSRASGMDSEEVGLGVIQDLAAVEHDKINNLFQNFNFDVAINADLTTAARLNYGLGAAAVWSLENSPVISGQIESPQEGLFEVSATAITVHDDAISDEPGQLQIAKFADRKDAKQGDVITFTIRYRNQGPREVHYVRIVDNLTPRLEYVEGSGTSDRDGRLAVEDNGEGSLVLTFEIAEPLPADAGGVTTFQARVR